MAMSLGARVAANPRGKEIGWSSLDFTPSGLSHPLSELGTLQVLHWHGDIFDLPDGAQSLASTAITPHQAFALGTYGLGIQFHLEVEAGGLERWLIGHRAELGQAGISIPALRKDNQLHAPRLAPSAGRVIDRWLDGAAS
jgi:GMP synthase (glutamine-hydrolysing)